MEAGEKEKEKEKETEKETEVEIEYITEEPEIYDPNYIFFKRIFEAFKVAADFRAEVLNWWSGTFCPDHEVTTQLCYQVKIDRSREREKMLVAYSFIYLFQNK